MIKNCSNTNNPYLVLCAGVMRSGSTWAYNATRFLLQAERAAPVYGSWISDYDPSRTEKFHVVKIHEGNNSIAIRAQVIITSHRDLRDIVASAWLKEWIHTEEQALKFVSDAVVCHTFWRSRGALDLQYETIRDAPLSAIMKIADRLDCEETIDFPGILAKIDALPMPNLGEAPDPVTLLHTRHRMDGRNGYFTEVVPSAVIARIEKVFGKWLKEHRFVT